MYGTSSHPPLVCWNNLPSGWSCSLHLDIENTCFCWPVEVSEQFTGLHRFEVSSPKFTASNHRKSEKWRPNTQWTFWLNGSLLQALKAVVSEKSRYPYNGHFYRENHDWPMDFGILTLTHDKTHHKALSPLSSHKKLALRTQGPHQDTPESLFFFFFCVCDLRYFNYVVYSTLYMT